LGESDFWGFFHQASSIPSNKFEFQFKTLRSNCISCSHSIFLLYSLFNYFPSFGCLQSFSPLQRHWSVYRCNVLCTQIFGFLYFSLSFHNPATGKNKEAEHTTAATVNTSDPFLFLDSRFIFGFQICSLFVPSIYGDVCFLLYSQVFFFFHV
jgi:hypothetical protein